MFFPDEELDVLGDHEDRRGRALAHAEAQRPPGGAGALQHHLDVDGRLAHRVAAGRPDGALHHGEVAAAGEVVVGAAFEPVVVHVLDEETR